ncbi:MULTISPECIES: hypothetical protein [unclassified Pseudomonas]|uniref:hypothetical protein n=1 Tax=unclassified Pseudomonas TaxID=196821 RepID=UPI002AC93586|nr:MULTISPECIES: hypothetical protein [unclassified Pseudomonas]MEB0039747.1 hypothetical protein [Pseudomonas sp. MH10]MEB0075703.1 hypothetical protein [Pseudomonas sp. MH10out]MEB0093002.1 hypothetical protein [Pseudomonas sp. CCI4.2]MEB0099820.1 hypothetical protein [Pseudomonas sp. CCI3.2]MEB0131022.1 hypothetical protein [Pseudomonas sp. CCI2.4]
MTNNKDSRTSSPSKSKPKLDLDTAVEQYIQRGGVINVVPLGETAEFSAESLPPKNPPIETEEDALKKIELLKNLVAKGAGVSSLQYSLRMTKKDVRRMAGEQGLKISYSRPVRGARTEGLRDPDAVDDRVAGHAMHYSSLGYTALEIAQKLNLSVRQVWEIGRDYRFEFKQMKDTPSPDALPGE